jgi:quinol monooxygenase YgiN
MSNPGTYHLHVTLKPNPARREEFISCIKNNQKNTLDKSIEPNCMLYKWGESTTEKNVFYFTEQYTNEEGFKHHTKTLHFAEWEQYASSQDAFVEPPVVNFWVEM